MSAAQQARDWLALLEDPADMVGDVHPEDEATVLGAALVCAVLALAESVAAAGHDVSTAVNRMAVLR